MPALWLSFSLGCAGTDSDRRTTVVLEKEDDALAEARLLGYQGKPEAAFERLYALAIERPASLVVLGDVADAARSEEDRARVARLIESREAGADPMLRTSMRVLHARLEPDLVRREARLESIAEADPSQSGYPTAALGEIYLRRGNPAAAAAAFKTALDRTPNLALAHLGLARAELEQGRPFAAVAPYESYLAAYPNDPEALYNLGWILLDKRGKPRDARPYLERAERILPDDPAILLALGTVDLESSPPDLAAAEAAFRHAAAVAPDDPDVHWNLGVLLGDHLGKPEEALLAYRRCLALGGEPKERINEAIRTLEAKKAPR